MKEKLDKHFLTPIFFPLNSHDVGWQNVFCGYSLCFLKWSERVTTVNSLKTCKLVHSKLRSQVLVRAALFPSSAGPEQGAGGPTSRILCSSARLPNPGLLSGYWRHSNWPPGKYSHPSVPAGNEFRDPTPTPKY